MRHHRAEPAMPDLRGNDSAPGTAGGEAVTLAELSQLWWFADGAIMNPDTRAHLRRSWGLCTRHAWLYFRVETELRIHPLGNAVLMADLVRRAAERVTGRGSVARKLAQLDTRGSCFTCDYGDHGQARFTRQLAQVNCGDATARWCRASQRVWQPRMCPACTTHAHATPGVLCRTHLISEAARLRGEALPGDYLVALAERLGRCVKSMTVDGPDRSPDTDAALVEAIGWVSGWRLGLAR